MDVPVVCWGNPKKGGDLNKHFHATVVSPRSMLALALCTLGSGECLCLGSPASPVLLLTSRHCIAKCPGGTASCCLVPGMDGHAFCLCTRLPTHLPTR